MVGELGNKFPWLYSCVQRFDITDIGEQHDARQLLAVDKASHIKRDINITANRAKDSTKHYTPKELEILEKSKQAIKKMKATDSHSKDKGSER